MALGSVVVCPDVIGNRSFCIPSGTAFLPTYTTDEVIGATRTALEADHTSYIAAGREMAASHSLIGERERFLGILKSV